METGPTREFVKIRAAPPAHAPEHIRNFLITYSPYQRNNEISCVHALRCMNTANFMDKRGER